MSGAGSGVPDLLESGGPDRPRRFSARVGPGSGGWPAGFARRHRRVVVGGLVAAVAAGGLAYRWYDQRPPRVPDVRLTADRSAESVPLWSPGIDGRPVSGVTLSVSARLAVPGLAPGDPQVRALGLTGPGLGRPGVFPHTVLGAQPGEYDLTGQVDCERVPLPVAADAYAVRVEVRDGGRTSLSTVPLAESRSALDARVTTGCSTWLAARDLTVTSVRAVVDPARPHLDLVLQVANAGGRAALVWLGDTTGTGARVTPVRLVVPARGAAPVSVSVDLDRCWSWSQVSGPTTAVDIPVPLLGAVGIASPPLAGSSPDSPGGSGLVLLPGVAQQLQDAFIAACAGVSSPVLLTAPGSGSYDARTRVLTTRVVVDLPPGVVRSVRFVPLQENGGELIPIFETSPWLRPDSTGQAGWTVRMAVPQGAPCLGGGPFVVLAVELLVPRPGGGVRPARFELAAESALPDAQIAAACSHSG